MKTTYPFALLIIILSIRCADHKLPAPIQCDDNPVILDLVSVVDADCILKNGIIEVNASGGTGNYLFRVNGGEPQIASVFVDLGAGVYEVSAEDDNNCRGTLEVTVRNKEGVNISFQTTAAGCKESNGTITVEAFNGVEPYEYKIGNSSYSSANTFTDLAHGDHTVVVRDNSGCELAQTVKVKSGISYSASVDTIIETNCVVSGCHNGSQFPDFRNFNNIQANAAQIKTLTGNRTMPENGSLTQAEIDLIACWVDDGASNN